MALDLPPRMLIRGGDRTAQDVHREFTSVISGHGNATTTYRFYEELDSWLGPWGEHGYPIGYGKKYNILFTENKALNANPTTEQWIWKTTIKLQEALRDYIVWMVRHDKIQMVTEPMLRRKAFESHARAYTESGLATVILVEPGLLPVIASIPYAELVPCGALHSGIKNYIRQSGVNQEWGPCSENYWAARLQVLGTAVLLAPRLASNLLAAAMPGHSGSYRNAARRSMNTQLRQNNQGIAMQRTQELIEQGKFDQLPVLDEIIRATGSSQYPDAATLRNAQAIIRSAKKRRSKIWSGTKAMLQDAPLILRDVKDEYPEFDSY